MQPCLKYSKWPKVRARSGGRGPQCVGLWFLATFVWSFPSPQFLCQLYLFFSPRVDLENPGRNEWYTRVPTPSHLRPQDHEHSYCVCSPLLTGFILIKTSSPSGEPVISEEFVQFWRWHRKFDLCNFLSFHFFATIPGSSFLPFRFSFSSPWSFSS